MPLPTPNPINHALGGLTAQIVNMVEKLAETRSGSGTPQPAGSNQKKVTSFLTKRIFLGGGVNLWQ